MILAMISFGHSTRGIAFPLWEECLRSTLDLVDSVIIRWDTHTGDPAVRDAIPDICGGKLKSLILGKSKWNRFNWRESMLREIDVLRLKPMIVLTPDQDEKFGPGIHDDLEALMRSSRSALMFTYRMMTCDGAKVPLYPRLSHMKAFKWRERLSYKPYRMRAQVHNYSNRSHHIGARSNMLHYCYYTPELRTYLNKPQGTNGKAESMPVAVDLDKGPHPALPPVTDFQI